MKNKLIQMKIKYGINEEWTKIKILTDTLILLITLYNNKRQI
jgi:hypothetical protein